MKRAFFCRHRIAFGAALVVLLLGSTGDLIAQEVTFTPEVRPAVFGNRIPQYYFVTSGSGDTDIGPGDDPWETGSYDLALLEANLANFNVVPYTSVLPPEAKEVSLEFAEQYFHHGAVVEMIMAQQNACKYDTLTTGVGRIWVRDKVTGALIGGFAAEYEKVYECSPGSVASNCKNGTKKCAAVPEQQAVGEAEKMLRTSLEGEVCRRYNAAICAQKTPGLREVEAFGTTFKTDYEYVDKSFGTSLTALAWVTYLYPQHKR